MGAGGWDNDVPYAALPLQLSDSRIGSAQAQIFLKFNSIIPNMSRASVVQIGSCGGVETRPDRRRSVMQVKDRQLGAGEATTSSSAKYLTEYQKGRAQCLL